MATTTATIRDKGRGRVTLTLRDGVVVGAMGSEPERFMGLTEADARKLAAGRMATVDESERTALQRYATAHGRTWKSQLSLAWCTGHDEREVDAGALRSVRNRLGPTWLMRQCKIRP